MAVFPERMFLVSSGAWQVLAVHPLVPAHVCICAYTDGFSGASLQDTRVSPRTRCGGDGLRLLSGL